MFLSLETLSTIRTRLPILVELIHLVNSVGIFVSNDLSEMVNFPTWISDWFLQSCSFGFIFLLMLVFVLYSLSLHWEVLIMLSQFLLTFHHIHNWLPCFIALLLTILVLIGTVFVIIWEMFCGRISLNSASAAANEFFECFQAGSDVYIPYQKYQLKLHSSPWF